MKLALGTVQFGIDYGITNDTGRVSLDEVRDILAYSKSQGIDLLDTAALYGDSEQVLGRMGSSDVFRVVTKSGLTDGRPYALANSLFRSLDRLNRDSVDGFLLHRTDDLLGDEGDRFYSVLESLKASGRVNKIGVSVYYPEETDLLIARYGLDIVQLPFSALDQRFFVSGCLQRLADRGVEIHARSLFLQGALLSEMAALPQSLSSYLPAFQRYHQRRQDLGMLEFSLGICHQHEEIDRYVIGCCNRTQLKQIVTAYNSAESLAIDYRGIGCCDEGLVIPGNW